MLSGCFFYQGAPWISAVNGTNEYDRMDDEEKGWPRDGGAALPTSSISGDKQQQDMAGAAASADTASGSKAAASKAPAAAPSANLGGISFGSGAVLEPALFENRHVEA